MRKRFQRVIASIAIKFYPWFSQISDQFHQMNFEKLVAVGSVKRIMAPYYLKGCKHITIGTDFSAGAGLRMEAWDKYYIYTYSPSIIIGNNVSLNFNVHIGAINRVEIHDNTLIGSNVLIIDHQHGDQQKSISAPYKYSPLCSKGPVIIEENVWVGEGACIMPNITIGKNAIVGANAVVTQNVAPATIVAGIPAKRIKSVNITY
jgi:acetyltransferase-like isoleucine patch superfamily enzyme